MFIGFSLQTIIEFVYWTIRISHEIWLKHGRHRKVGSILAKHGYISKTAYLSNFGDINLKAKSNPMYKLKTFFHPD